MTFQYLTFAMIIKAKTNNGFIDQTEFKTANKYSFDTLIMTDDVLTVLEFYVDFVRPLLNPVCDYLLVSNTGNQYQSLTTAMTMLVYQAIGKYIHPTRYRQIVETASAERLTREEQEVVSEDQKHSSTVAKMHYRKKQSRTVAIEGKRCMEKMVGSLRNDTTKDIMSILGTINNGFDNAVLEKSRNILTQVGSSAQPLVGTSRSSYEWTPSSTITSNADLGIIQKTNDILSNAYRDDSEMEISPTVDFSNARMQEDVVITGILNPPVIDLERFHKPTISQKEISNDVKIKTEVAQNEVKKSTPRNVKFTVEEDESLRHGIMKYGKKSWASILKDENSKFHFSRTRDSLRMRAESATLKKNMIEGR